MRRFRFVGDPSEYHRNIKLGKVYSQDFVPWTDTGLYEPFSGFNKNKNVLDAASRYPKDWQEVFDSEEPTKPIHKDTDLGYYAGLAMQGQFSQVDKYIEIYDENWIDPFIQNSILLAKELIKQLNEETK